MSYAFLTEENPNASLHKMAQAMRERLGGSIYTKPTKVKEDRVICVYPGYVCPLFNNWRLNAGKKIVVVFAAAHIDYVKHDLIQVLACIGLNKVTTVTQSPFTHTGLQKEASKSMSATLARKVVDQLTYIPWGVGDEFKFHKGNKDKWIVPANAWNAPYKRHPLTHELTVKAEALIARHGGQPQTQFNVFSNLKQPP